MWITRVSIQNPVFAAMVMVAPIFSSNFVSARARLLLALAASMVIIPSIPGTMPQVEPLSATGLLIIAQQILIGACMGSLYVGFRLVLMSPLAFLARPGRWLWTICRHRATVSAAPNFAFEMCARFPPFLVLPRFGGHTEKHLA